MAIDIKSMVKLDTIMKLPLPKKLMVLAGINALLVAAVYYLLLGPGYIEVKVQETALEEVLVKLESDKEIARDIPKYQKEKADLEKQLKIALEQLPNKKEIEGLLQSISDTAVDVGLVIELFKPGKEVIKGFYAEVPINMNVSGPYDAVYGFADGVGKLPRIVNISNITMKSVPQKKGAETLKPKLKSSFKVTTFRFISDEELKRIEKKKKNKKKK